MRPRVLTEREMHYIALFESLTGAVVEDCVIDDKNNRIIFVVKEGQVSIAVGKNGVKIRRLRELLKKDIEVVEFAETPEELLKNSLFPARVHSVRITKTANNKKVAIVSVPPSDKGLAIGREGRNVAKAKLLMKRYFDIDKVIII